MIKAVDGTQCDRLPRLTLSIWMGAMLAFQTGVRAQAPKDRAIDIWRNVRAALTSGDGDTFFKQINHAMIPPEVLFDGTVVSQPSRTDLLVDVDSAAGDATLTFRHPLKGVVPGTLIHFQGVIESYRKEPYMLRLDCDDDDVHGLTNSK
jgi:hypothetical protein